MLVVTLCKYKNALASVPFVFPGVAQPPIPSSESLETLITHQALEQ